MVVQRNPVVSAIYLIANFFSLAGLYLVLRAQLLAVLQIVVYAGAIMVLVIFVIMLLNLGDERSLVEKINFRLVIGVTVALAFLLEMLYIFLGIANDGTTPGLHPQAATIGTVESMGSALFGQYVFPFEITSLLLLAAIIGAVVLAKKRDPNT